MPGSVCTGRCTDGVAALAAALAPAPSLPAGAVPADVTGVAIYGLATLIFGLSRNIWLSVAALAVLDGRGPRVRGARRGWLRHWPVDRS